MTGEASGSFLKKRTKKLLFPWARVEENAATAGPKVFCFFSSEKKALPDFKASTSKADDVSKRLLRRERKSFLFSGSLLRQTPRQNTALFLEKEGLQASL